MKANLLAASALLILIITSAAQEPYGSGECIKSFVIGMDLQNTPVPIGLEGFNIYIDGVYKGSTDKDGKLGASAYGGQHAINASKQMGPDTYSGSWIGTIECDYPAGGTTYVPIAINQIPREVSAQVQPPVINIPEPKNIGDVLLVVVIAVALIIGIVIVLKSLRYFLVNAILGLVVLFLANTFAGLNIAYTWLVILVCAIGGIAGAIIVIILHLYGIII